MKSLLGSCVFICLALGCQRSPTANKIEDVEKHPLLQRPPAPEEAAKAPLPKAPNAVQSPAKQPVPQPPLTLDEAVALALDPTVTQWKRLEGFQAVHRMKPEERIEGMRRLAEAPMPDMAMSATVQLMKAGAPDVVAVACRRLPDWSVNEQVTVLGAVREAALRLDAKNPALREIPRQALANLLKEGVDVKERENPRSYKTALVDVCAMILSHNAEPPDKQLLQKTAQRHPQCAFLWLVLGRLKGITDLEEQLARKTYQDENLPVLVRAAAATALSGQDAAGAAFAEKQIRGHLARYGSRFTEDEIKSIGKVGGKAAFDQLIQEYSGFRKEQDLVMMLRFLETPAAEALTFEAYQCKNIYILQSAAAVAACRWPKRFLDGGQGPLLREDYANLLALVAVKQPHLRDEVLKKIPEKELEAARARLRRQYSSPGGVHSTDKLIFLFF